MLDGYCIGNFNQNRMSEIDAKGKEIGFLERSLVVDQQCLLCRHYNLCRGGCQRNRDYNKETGRFKNYFCQGYKKFFVACGEEIKRIGETLLRCTIS